jgi:Leucine-rich repeat (LRR) protein
VQVVSFVANQLAALPREIGMLEVLEVLILDENRLTSLPTEIGKLYNLKFLSASSNELISLPHTIGDLTQLNTLLLSLNQIQYLNVELSQLRELKELDVTGNPLLFPPESVAAQGTASISKNPLESKKQETRNLVFFFFFSLIVSWLRDIGEGSQQFMRMKLGLLGPGSPSIPFLFFFFFVSDNF